VTPLTATHSSPSTVPGSLYHHVVKGAATVAAQAFRAAVARSTGALGGHIGEDLSKALTEPHAAERRRIPPLHSPLRDPFRSRRRRTMEELVITLPPLPRIVAFLEVSPSFGIRDGRRQAQRLHQEAEDECGGREVGKAAYSSMSAGLAPSGTWGLAGSEVGRGPSSMVHSRVVIHPLFDFVALRVGAGMASFAAGDDSTWWMHVF
jgi:hypothetical protein